jgi:hypothetical protein
MLGKLMKYEWKATWKLLLPINLLIIVMTFLACITVQVDFFNSDNPMVAFGAVMIMLTYIGSMFVVLIGTAIYLIYRFYTSTYGEQGYLLHTLPVDKHHIIIAKVLVSAAWIFISMMLMIMSIMFLFAEQGEFFADFFESFQSVIEYWGGDELSGFVLLMTLIAMVFSIFARVLKVTASISMGQMSANHKLLSSFGFYFAFYVIQRIFTLLYYVFVEIVNGVSDTLLLSYFSNSWEGTLISSILYSVVFYLLTWYMMEHKLNLE